MIVHLQNEVASIADDFATLAETVDTIADELDALNNLDDLSTIVETITAIEARTWNLEYTNNSVVNRMAPAGWFETPMFTVQGRLMRLDWTLWCDAVGLTKLDVELLFANGTLLDTVGSQLDTIRSTRVASERYYSVDPGDYYLKVRVREGSGS